MTESTHNFSKMDCAEDNTSRIDISTYDGHDSGSENSRCDHRWFFFSLFAFFPCLFSDFGAIFLTLGFVNGRSLLILVIYLDKCSRLFLFHHCISINWFINSMDIKVLISSHLSCLRIQELYPGSPIAKIYDSLCSELYERLQLTIAPSFSWFQYGNENSSAKLLFFPLCSFIQIVPLKSKR